MPLPPTAARSLFEEKNTLAFFLLLQIKKNKTGNEYSPGVFEVSAELSALFESMLAPEKERIEAAASQPARPSLGRFRESDIRGRVVSSRKRSSARSQKAFSSARPKDTSRKPRDSSPHMLEKANETISEIDPTESRGVRRDTTRCDFLELRTPSFRTARARETLRSSVGRRRARSSRGASLANPPELSERKRTRPLPSRLLFERAVENRDGSPRALSLSSERASERERKF